MSNAVRLPHLIEVLAGQRQGYCLEWRSDQQPVATIGRSAECTLCLSDDHVSGMHAELRVNDHKIMFMDLGSTNGSALRQHTGEVFPIRPQQAVEVQDSDLLLLGDGDSPVVLKITRQALQRTIDKTLVTTGPQGRVMAAAQVGHLPAVEGRVSADHRQLRLLYEGLKALNQPLHLQQVIKAGIELIFRLLPPATHVTVILDPSPADQKDAKSGEPVMCLRRDGQPHMPDRPSRWILKRLRRERAALLIADLEAEEDASQSLQSAAIHSMIAAPLMAADRIMGVLQIDHRHTEPHLAEAAVFTQPHLECAMVVASHLALAIDNALLYQRLRHAEEQLQSENRFLKKRESQIEMIGTSDTTRQVQSLIERVCNTSVSVCILGETGTGKELVARSIHYRSGRREKLFIAQNCAALPADLLESELFGHKKGAFTGADANKKGLFELADGGTIFLDEIGETSPALQAKLLRVLQEGEVRPVGSSSTIKVDVRVLSATNRNLEDEVAQGRFREDLYYRINVFPIRLPPLRERKQDIPLLADYFSRKFAPELGCEALPFSPSALDLFCSYEWPGNIRELQNEIQRIMICKHLGGYILPEDLSPRIRNTEMLIHMAGDNGSGYLSERLRAVERYMINEALQANDNNKTRTARALGITREGLHKKLARYSI